MQILGALLKIPGGKSSSIHSIPIPWWHRAPLGLVNDTIVNIAILPNEERPVGDLIVSVIDPKKWTAVKKISILHSDAPGVVSKIFSLIPPLNISIAESVTMEGGKSHLVEMMCESRGVFDEIKDIRKVDKEKVEKSFNELMDRLTKSGFISSKVYSEFERSFTSWPVASSQGLVRYGIVDTHFRWKDQIGKHFPDGVDQVDLSLAVVSADTERRLIRFIFPRNGAFTIEVTHADMVGALSAITAAIADCNLNILSSLLRRGVRYQSQHKFIAVCEPNPGVNVNLAKSKLKILLDEIQSSFDIDAMFKPDPGSSWEARYINNPKSINIMPPVELIPAIENEKKKLRQNKKIGVFISHRFYMNTEKGYRILSEVKDALNDVGCEFLDAPIDHKDDSEMTRTLVESRMWAASAGLVIAVPREAERPIDAMTLSLAHEYGFMNGQGKRVGVLVQADMIDQVLGKFWNILGKKHVPYSRNESEILDRKHIDSVYQVVQMWARNHT